MCSNTLLTSYCPRGAAPMPADVCEIAAQIDGLLEGQGREFSGEVKAVLRLAKEQAQEVGGRLQAREEQVSSPALSFAFSTKSPLLAGDQGRQAAGGSGLHVYRFPRQGPRRLPSSR